MDASLPSSTTVSFSSTIPRAVLPGFKELLSLGQIPRPTSVRSPTHAHTSSHPSAESQNRRPSLVDDLSQSQADPTRRHTRAKPYDTRDRSLSPPRRERSSSSQHSRKRKDTFDREEQRKAKLENDPWSDKTRLTPKSVFCLGCKRVIRLDRRNDYYPGLWLKHRDLCQGIAKAKREANERQKEQKPEETPRYSIDEEEAARILVEMMMKNRCFLNDSGRSPSP
ncbi:hypothetical protein VNI00_006823 [Paramarasmius palmivorus]|uniref:Uncharacterized protein n=1 Tax=Paramarasmius palmivorus TaxID=297713 RepID=A0AAW0D7L5_9AGAR